MKLYEVHSEIEKLEIKMLSYAEENEGDLTGFPYESELDGLEIDRTEKALSIAVYIKNILSDANALKIEKDNLVKRQKACESKAESLKSYLGAFLPEGEKLDSAQVSIGWRTSSSVYIPDVMEFKNADSRFYKTEIKTQWIKADIKKAIKSGEVDWARIDTKQKIQVK